MKPVLFVTIAILFFAGPGMAQEMNKTIFDEEAGEEILIGLINREGLKDGLFSPYIDEQYPVYEPDKGVVSKIKELTEGISILVVLGTWCGDSQEQVPRFLKVMDRVKFPKEQLIIVGVDRAKKCEDMDMDNYQIERVPTFIIFKAKEELGRIIETPQTTLEQDLLSILE